MTAKEYLSQAWNIDNEIQSMLEEVAVLRSMTVLYLRYMRYRSWAEIATEMKLGLRQIYRLHGGGLKNIFPMSLHVTK